MWKTGNIDPHFLRSYCGEISRLICVETALQKHRPFSDRLDKVSHITAANGVEVQLYSFLISEPDDLSGEHPAPHILPPEKEPPLPNEFGGWVGARAGLDALGERKISFHLRESGHDPAVVDPVGRACENRSVCSC